MINAFRKRPNSVRAWRLHVYAIRIRLPAYAYVSSSADTSPRQSRLGKHLRKYLPTKWQLLLVYGNALRILFFAAVVLWLPISSVAQSTFVPSAEASKVFLPLDQANDSLRGPGALWLLDRARECQYVMFGEQHGVEGIAQLVEAVYGDLQTSGFEYLALEIGPWISERLSQDGVTATIQRFPHSIAFDYDGDIQLMRFAESTSSNRGQTIWGMDQETDGDSSPSSDWKNLPPT